MVNIRFHTKNLSNKTYRTPYVTGKCLSCYRVWAEVVRKYRNLRNRINEKLKNRPDYKKLKVPKHSQVDSTTSPLPLILIWMKKVWGPWRLFEWVYFSVELARYKNKNVCIHLEMTLAVGWEIGSQEHYLVLEVRMFKLFILKLKSIIKIVIQLIQKG